MPRTCSALRVAPLSVAARENLRDVGLRLLLGHGLLGLLLAAVEVVAGLAVGSPPWPPTGWLRALVVVGGVVAAALPALVVGRRLDGALRSFLLRLPREDRWVGTWVAALAGMWLALLVLSVLPAPGRVLAVQVAVALSVPGFWVPALVVGLPLAAQRFGHRG